MKRICFSIGTIILCSIGDFILAKPSGADRSFDNNEKLHCADSDEESNYETKKNSFSDSYKPHSKFEGSEKYPNRAFDFNEKRSVSDELDNLANSPLQKRQVGVVYRDDKPIGILQPYQRSYRFIPVNEDNFYGLNLEQDSLIPSATAGVDKREINSLNPSQNLKENYPSILTNFKIGNKMDKKRNFDGLTDENVSDLKATIRRLRSSNPHNSEQIEEELKNILDDMGLIDDEEIHAEKREIIEDEKDAEDEDKERGKRDENYDTVASNEHNLLSENNNLNKRELSEESSSETNRKKRQKESQESSELVQNLKESGDLMVSGNKSPLASSSEITVKDDVDDDKRVERQIQSKIDLLREEVKREIAALKNKENEDESQRKKRQVADNLVDEETDELNPAINSETNLKPLIRKKRTLAESTSTLKSRKKRETDLSFGNREKRRTLHSPDNHSNEQHFKGRQDESDEGGELLGDDFSDSSVAKRQIFNPELDYPELARENPSDYRRNKRARGLDFYDNYMYFYDDDNERLKRQNVDDNDELEEKPRSGSFIPQRPIRLRSRIRRRISDNQALANRPQQLSDMSDLDLFGALPKSYDGELSRYKRVKRK